MNEPLLIDLGSLICAVVGAVAGAIGVLWKQWHDQKRTTDKDALSEYKELVQTLRGEVAAIKSELDALRADYVQCQIEVAELHGWLVNLHGLAMRQAAEIVRRGGIPEPVPDLPPRRHPRTVATATLHAAANASATAKPSSGGATP